MRAAAVVVVIAACSGSAPRPAGVAVVPRAPPPAVAAAPPRAELAEPGRAPGRPASTAPVVQLVAAHAHACARHSDGTVSCWGENELGQLGAAVVRGTASRDERVIRDVPVGGPVTGVLEIATDSDRTCVRRADGVWCWGSPADEPEHVAGSEGAVAITRSCGRDAAGDVRCWNEVLTADAEPTTRGAIAVATGGGRTCTLDRRGAVRCTPGPTWLDANRPRRVKGAVEVAVAGDHVCVRTARGGVSCWTSSDYYVSGGRPIHGPIAIDIHDAVQIAVAPEAACALRAGGRVACWGAGAIGGGGTPRRPVPVRDLIADELAIGEEFACARTGGAVVCWGHNARGQTGIGWSLVRVAPIAVPGIAEASRVYALGNASCAILRSGAVQCWGVLPRGGSDPVPREQTGFAGAVALADSGSLCARFATGEVRCADLLEAAITDATDFAGTYEHGVAVVDGGSILSWGENTFGAFGDGTEVTGPSTIAHGVDDAFAVSANHDATCFIRRGGEVACAGRDLASPPSEAPVAITLPRRVAGIEHATQIAVGYEHVCALEAGGTVACWGQGGFGRLGRDVGWSAVAVRVPELDHVVQISGSAETTCARRDDGSVACWGNNDTALLGDPAGQGWSARPIRVPITGAVDVSVGEHACVVVAAGDVLCWGRADAGQVGTMRSESVSAPTPVAFPMAIDASSPVATDPAR